MNFNGWLRSQNQKDLVCAIIKRSSEVCGLDCFNIPTADKLDCAQNQHVRPSPEFPSCWSEMIPIIDNHRVDGNKERVAGVGNFDFQILP